MMLRKVVPAFLVLLFCFPILPAHADDVSRKEKVHQLFELTRLNQTYNQLMTQMLAQSDQVATSLFPAGDVTEKQKKEMADFKSRANALVRNSFSWDILEPEYMTLYTNTYTEAELDGMIAFYSSTVGQSMLDKTPQLMKASSEIAMTHMADIEPKMRQLIEDSKKQIVADQTGSGKSQ